MTLQYRLLLAEREATGRLDASLGNPSSMVALLSRRSGVEAPSDSDQRLSAALVAKELAPRKQVHAVYLLWQESLDYVLSLHLYFMLGSPITQESEFIFRFSATLSPEEIVSLFEFKLNEFQCANTSLFHLVRSSLDLSGPMIKIDIAMFSTARFKVGSMYDGLELVAWVGPPRA